jgi:hypothetical protein
VVFSNIHLHHRIIAVHPFYRSSFGSFLSELFRDIFTKPSHDTFLLLSLGFVYAFTRHSIASYLWRAGAATYKHFTRFYVFFGAPCYERLEPLFARVILAAAEHVALEEPIRLRFDDTTRKKSGRKIEGVSTYRNGAGTARQEYRTLFGLNFVLGEMRIELSGEHVVSVPIGLKLYLKEAQALELGQPYQTRSELARTMLDQVCRLLNRPVLSVQDGEYSTKKFLQNLPENAHVVGRLPIDSVLYGAIAARPPGRRGRRPKKGPRLGNAKELAEAAATWQPHPTDPAAEMITVEGYWHSVLPGCWLRVVIVRRPPEQVTRQKKPLEAFFTTSLALEAEQMLSEQRGRWSVEILIREANEHYGLGRDRCRKYERIVGVNGFRMLIGAAQVLWFAREVKQPLAAHRYQPWYLQKEHPSLHDICWAVRERLMLEGIIPTVGFGEGVAEIDRFQAKKHTAYMSRAA